jgi:ketosteroid isomerase-like protein
MLEGRIQHMFDAVNRKDLAAVMKGWAEDGVLEFPGRSSLSGRYEGKAAIEAFFRRWFERMTSIRLTVRHVAFANPVALDLANTMYVEFETDQVTVEGLSFHTEVVGVYRLRRRKLVYYREYLFDPELALTVWGPTSTPSSGG